MRWLITGAHGQLGSDLRRVLAADPDEVLAVGSGDLDVTSSAAVEAAVARFRPDVILNAAAYTAVDAAESDEDRAYAVNATGPALLAASAVRHGARLITVSTDYVFDGTATSPYAPDAATAPRSAYGRTKLAGELAVRELAPDVGYVVRTAWVYGETGKNFVKTMARLQAERETVSVVDDQRGGPTWSRQLAQRLVELGRADVAPGVYHCTGGGDCTWFELAQAVFTELGADPARVLPTTSADFVTPAPRPAYSVLSAQEWAGAGLTPMPHWREGLSEAFTACGDALRGVAQADASA